MSELHDTLRSLVNRAGHWTEARYHSKRGRALMVRRSEVVEMASQRNHGVGLRVLVDGTWGFAATSDLTSGGLERALQRAEAMASALARVKKKRVRLAEGGELARGEFLVPGYEELDAMPLEEKFRVVRESEARLRASSDQIETASCRYTEGFEDKIIVTSDGVDARIRLVRPSLRFGATGADGQRRTNGQDSVGGTGAWECLFNNRDADVMIDQAASDAVNQLSAADAEGGRKQVILSPAMVGLLSHEAIGHTVEADFVSAGSVAAGRIGEMVASELVTLCDSGVSEYADGAGGIVPVDDEGVVAGRTPIIENGRLVSYLHSRESAAEYDVEPTGNGRAFTYRDEPLIRMRNTYIEPGESDLSDMIEGIDDGYFIDGPGGGQADATAEFMFGATRVRRIRGGELGETVKHLAVSGNAFEVLQSVDAVSTDFQWDLGSGYCGKGQPAKVDAGGPYIRCELMIGGAQ